MFYNNHKIQLLKNNLLLSCIVLLALLMSVVGVGCGNKSEALSQSGEMKIIEELETFTTLYVENDKYIFMDNDKAWALTYGEANEFVTFENNTVIKCFTDAFGEGCFVENSASGLGFAYDIDENEGRIYLDVETEEGYLSIVNYNFEREEYTVNIDGDRYEISNDFNNFLSEYELSQYMQMDVEQFEQEILEHGLTISDLLSVEYGTLEKQMIVEDSSINEEMNWSVQNADEIDMLQYVGSDINILLQEDPNIIAESDGMFYYDVSGNVTISEIDGIIDMFLMEGNSEPRICFAGVTVGDSAYNIDENTLANAGYAYYAEDTLGITYMHTNGRCGVMYGIDEMKNITTITWMDTMGDIASTSEQNVEDYSEVDIDPTVFWGNYGCYERADGMSITVYAIDKESCYITLGNSDGTVDVRDVLFTKFDNYTALHEGPEDAKIRMDIDYEFGRLSLHQTGELAYCEGVDFSGEYVGVQDTYVPDVW